MALKNGCKWCRWRVEFSSCWLHLREEFFFCNIQNLGLAVVVKELTFFDEFSKWFNAFLQYLSHGWLVSGFRCAAFVPLEVAAGKRRSQSQLQCSGHSATCQALKTFLFPQRKALKKKKSWHSRCQQQFFNVCLLKKRRGMWNHMINSLARWLLMS